MLTHRGAAQQSMGLLALSATLWDRPASGGRRWRTVPPVDDQGV